MATFRVGQRVRCISYPLNCSSLIGREGMVDHFAAEYVEVRFDGITSPASGGNGCFAMLPSELAPLTDPLADAFIEFLKKLAREPMPLERVS